MKCVATLQMDFTPSFYRQFSSDRIHCTIDPKRNEVCGNPTNAFHPPHFNVSFPSDRIHCTVDPKRNEACVATLEMDFTPSFYHQFSIRSCTLHDPKRNEVCGNPGNNGLYPLIIPSVFRPIVLRNRSKKRILSFCARPTDVAPC